MGRKRQWHGLLIAGAIMLAAAQTVQAEPLVEVSVPQVSVPAVPQVSVPQVSVPQVSVPQVSVPQVSVPQVSVPQVSAPQVSAPQVSAPQVSAPQVSAPATPQAAANPLSNAPAPTPTQQRALAQQPQTGSRTAPAAPAGDANASVAPTPTGNRKARPGTRSRRARQISREPSSQRLRRLLKPLAACVAALAPTQERVLVRRAGLRGFKPQTRRELARTLGTSRSRVAHLERRGLRNLRRAVRTGRCTAPAASAATPATSGTTLVAERVSARTESGGGSSSSRTQDERGAVKGITRSMRGSFVEAATREGRDALASITSPARSYADDHPLVFALTLVGAALSALLLVRERRRT